MLIILEGADGVGKSTLANEIAKQSNGIVIHSGYNKAWNIYKYHNELLAHAYELEEICGTVILDRFCLSEYVYGSVYRAGPSYDVFSLQRRVDAKWIFCTSDNIVENHNKLKKRRYEMFTQSMDKVNNLFARIVIKQSRDNSIPWIIYDYSKVDKKQFVKELLS